MATAIIIHALEPLERVTLPLTSAISKAVRLSEFVAVAEMFRGLVGGELVDKLERVFSEALDSEVYSALNSSGLEHELHYLVARFWARISLPLLELGVKLFSDPRVGDLERVKRIELDLGRAFATAIRGSGYRYAENLVYALSILIDRDLWIIDKVAKYGVEGLAKRLAERGLEPLLNLYGYTMYLTFTWTSATAATLGLIREFRESNRDTLAAWSREYAKEIDDYIDTLDLLLDDEVYSDLVELGIVKR